MNMVRIAIAAALLIGPAQGIAAARKGERADDPGREICKSRPVVGSRLKRVRECATAEQWEEMKLQEQVGLMRKQVNGDPGCSGGNSAACNPSLGGGRDTPW